MKTPRTKLARHQLIHQIRALEGQLASTYHFAEATLHKTGTKYCTASGVLLQLSSLGGVPLICPVVIKDGLSDATIEALKSDLARSYDLAVMFKPSLATESGK